MALNTYIRLKQNAFLVICLLGVGYVGVSMANVADHINDQVTDAIKLGIVCILCWVGYISGRDFIKFTHTTPVFFAAILFLILFHVTELTEEFALFGPVPLFGELTFAKRAFETTMMIGSICLLIGGAYFAAAEVNRAREQLDEHVRLIHEKEELNHKILETMLDGVAILGGGRIIYANSAFCRIYGYSLNELQEMHPHQLVHPDYRHELKRYFQDVHEHGAFQGETVDIRKDGTLFNTEVQGAGIELDGRMCFLAVIRDVTERKQAENQLQEYQGRLQALSYELSMSEEQERRRVAAVLHDNLCQELAMIKVSLQTLQQTLQDSQAVTTLERQCEIITDLLKEAHAMVFDLSNPVLYEVGLGAAIEDWLNHRIEGKSSLRCEFSSDLAGCKLKREPSILLLQSVRELVMNVVKHAQAQTMRVTLSQLGDCLHIRVQDDGVGFDPKSVEMTQQGGYGLFSVEERLKYMGAEMEIESLPQKGTAITVQVPLTENMVVVKERPSQTH